MKSEIEEAFARQIALVGLPDPEREYGFHPARRWRFDFAWPDALVAAEIEGGVWVRGRHTRGSGFVNDCRKYNEAAILGWKVLRFPGGWVESGEAIEMLERCL